MAGRLQAGGHRVEVELVAVPKRGGKSDPDLWVIALQADAPAVAATLAEVPA